MAKELGLHDKFKRMVMDPLDNYRGNPATAGRDITLEEFMQTRAGDEGKGLTNNIGEPLSMSDLWAEMGVDPSTITLDNLISRKDDMSYLAPEIVRDFVIKGYGASPYYKELCMSTESVDSMNVTTPWVQFDDATPQDTEQGETFDQASVSYGDKSVKLTKKGIAIEWTDELLLSTKLPLLKPYLQRVGVQLSYAMNSKAVTTLLNGDQSDGSDACEVIGVTTSGSLVFKDFTRAWIRGNGLAMNWNYMVTNEETAIDVVNIDEFLSPQGAGGAFVNVESKNRIIPANMGHQISESMDDGKVLLVDPKQAMVELVFMPLKVESDRIVQRQIQGTYVSIISGFTTTERAARIIIDENQLYSSNGFATWMAPLR